MAIRERLQQIYRDPERRAPTIGTSFLLSLTVLFFGPSYLYYMNILEIPYLYTDLVWVFVAYSLVAGAIISALLLFLRGSVHQRAVALIFVLGLLFWIQGHILVWDYGILDGREIIWNDYLLNGLIDSTIWIAALGVALIKGPSFYKHITVASVLVLVVQGGGLAAEMYQAPDEPEWKSYAITSNDGTMFEFSKEQNIIILVLDAFQSDVFQEIINEDDGYRKTFDGFTYYRNAVGGFPYTYASVTLILTGDYYDNSIPVQDFIKSAFIENSIPQVLRGNGYQVDLLPLVEGYIYRGDENASDRGSQQCSKEDREVDAQKGALELYRITLFRHTPQVLKSYFYFTPFIGQSGNDNVHQDVVFYNSLSSNTTISNKEKVFKYYHIFGAHLPYTLNAQLQNEDLPQNRSGCKEQSKASLNIAEELIEQLKKHEIYDNSMIIIIGDHGTSGGGIGLNLGLMNKNEQLELPMVHERVVASGIPLMLIKPFNSRGDLIMSDAPVTLGDIPQTIASELQLSNKFPGVSVLSLNESDERVRKYFHYAHSEEYQDVDGGYFYPMREYVINGNSWDLNSWKPTHYVYKPKEIMTDAANITRLRLFSIGTNVGNVHYDSSIEENVFFSSKLTNTSGFLVYGPYMHFPARDYTINYIVKVENITSPNDIVATVDVCSTYVNGSTPVHVVDAKKDVYGRELVEGKYAPISLNISVDTYNQDRLIQFRVFQPLHSDIYVKDINLQSRII